MWLTVFSEHLDILLDPLLQNVRISERAHLNKTYAFGPLVTISKKVTSELSLASQNNAIRAGVNTCECVVLCCVAPLARVL